MPDCHYILHNRCISRVEGTTRVGSLRWLVSSTKNFLGLFTRKKMNKKGGKNIIMCVFVTWETTNEPNGSFTLTDRIVAELPTCAFIIKSTCRLMMMLPVGSLSWLTRSLKVKDDWTRSILYTRTILATENCYCCCLDLFSARLRENFRGNLFPFFCLLLQWLNQLQSVGPTSGQETEPIIHLQGSIKK